MMVNNATGQDPLDPENDDLPIEDLVEVGRFPSQAAANDHGLVILAMGHPYWTFGVEDRVTLCVAAEIANDARFQLDCYEKENANWPPRAQDSDRDQRLQVLPSLIYFGVLAFAHLATTRPGTSALRDAGRMDAVAVINDGEWWRTLTALTLHADIGHLAANLGAGVFFAHFAARRYGAGVAWLLIVLSGALGNFFNAWIHHPDQHLSVGASTAVFGALGLIALPTHFSKATASIAKRATLISFAATIVVLGLYGTGGPQTDVLAHVTGFGSGVVLGWSTSKLENRIPNIQLVSQLAPIVTLGAVAGAWWLAWFGGLP